MNVTGKLKVIKQTEDVGSSGFQKRDCVVTTEEQFPQDILIQFVQDKCNLLNQFQVGQEVSIDINLRGRLWTNPQGEDVYFKTIQGWRISLVTNTNQSQTQQPHNSFADETKTNPKEFGNPLPGEEGDSLF